MLNWPQFVHAHIESIAAIVKANNCDFRLVMECSSLEAKDRPTVGGGSFGEDDYGIKFVAISVVSIDLAFNLLNSGSS